MKSISWKCLCNRNPSLMSVSGGKSLGIITLFAARKKEQTERQTVLPTSIPLDRQVVPNLENQGDRSTVPAARAEIQEHRNCSWVSHSFRPKVARLKTKSSLRDREATIARHVHNRGFTAFGPDISNNCGDWGDWGAEVQSVQSLRICAGAPELTLKKLGVVAHA